MFCYFRIYHTSIDKNYIIFPFYVDKVEKIVYNNSVDKILKHKQDE